MATQDIIRETEDKMKKALDALQHNLSTVRTGRASPVMVESIRVDYYGALTPLKQLANITIPEARLILIHPWDISAVKAIEKAIHESDLGISPAVDGKVVRLAVPPLTGERREELVKVVHRFAEESRVSMRTIRRDANDRIKQGEKAKTIAEDESFKALEHIQKLTDRYIQNIDQAQSAKEKELTQT